MASTSRDDGLDFLRFSKMEGNFSSMASSDNEDAKLPYIFKAEEGEDLHGRIVHSLLLKFCFLRVFLLSSLNIGEGSERLKGLFFQIRTVFQNVEKDLLRNGVDLDKFASEGNRWVQINIDDELLSSMQERLEDVNKDIKQVYDILSSKSSSFITGIMMTQEAVMENLNSLLMYVEDLKKPFNELVAPVKEEVEAALKKMRFLRNFLGFTARRCCESWELKDVINHAEFLVRNMSCLFYLCSSINDKMNEKMVNQMKMYLSSELHKFGPLQPEEVTEMYIKALKASKSAQGNSPMVVDEFDLGFLDSLEDAVLELDSPMASNKYQILSLHEEVRFLTISFAMYKLSDAHCNSNSLELDKFSNYFMEHISTLIIGMGCLIYSINYADKAMEFKLAVSDLQDIISIAKEESREEYETHIPKSWQLKTKFGTTNLWSTIRCLMKNFEKIKSYCSNSERQLMQAFHLGFGPYSLPCHLAKGLRKEMRSLEMAFGKFIQKHQPEHEVLEIQMIRLNDIRNRTANIISSFSQGVRGRSIPVFILIDEIKKIKMTFEGLQNQMMLDTSNFPEIFEDDAEEIGEQLINAYQESSSLPMNVRVIEIEDQDSDLDVICPLKDEFEAVRLKAAFLEVFLNCKGIWHIEDNNLKLLHTCMCNESQSTDQDFQRLLSELNVQISRKKSFCLPMLDCVVSSVVSRFLMPAMEEVCATVSKSSRFMTSISDETLMQNISILHENIDVLLKCNAETIAPLKEELEDVQRSLRFLRDFLGFTIKRCSKPRELKDLINHAEYLVGNVSYLLCLYCGNERMNDEIMNEMKTQFSSVIQMFSPAQTDVRETYIKALKASKSAKGSSIMLDEFDMDFLGSLRDDILKLSNNDLSCIAFNKDQVLPLQEELKFLITFFAMDRSLKEQHSEYPISSYFFETIDAFIIDTGCFIYSLKNDEKNEKMVKELNKKVSNLVASIMDVKKAARRMYDVYVPKPLQTDFPRTNAEGFISSLLWKLKEQLNTKFYVFSPLKNHIEIVQKELLSLREDFGRIAEQPSHCKELQSQWIRFVDVAYQIEHVIDSFMSMDRPIYSHKLALLNVIEDIRKIKMEPKATEIRTTDETSMDQPSSCSSTRVSVESSSKERLADEKSTIRVVIFDEEAEKIKDRLIAGSLNLNIISIVGMPGVGKSTLADSVFQHSSVSYYFHVRARCSVSQVHDRRRLLLEILQQVTDEVSIDADDLDQKLYRSLKGRRYLILLDDIWNIQPWNDIKVSFPDDQKGSRIIFISQNEDIASQTGLETIRCRLLPLSGEKSWKMLRMKLFGKESCPLELVSVGRKIAENCKGLPLTIDLVAGVLRVLERKEWKKVEESLMTVLFEDPQARCRKVVELSYQNLPEDLKPCFLYFAAFPEDANVPTRELILLWIAEGFVRLEETESRSLEAAAKDMLHNLISRSLVTISRRRPLGEVDANHVHDLLHEFAAAKAQEEKFMLKIGGKAKFSTSSSANVHDEWREQYRLSIYPDSLGRFLQSDPSGPRTRALISSSTPSLDALSLKFRAFKLLSVLYIPEVRSQFCPELFRLIHLKVLAIDTFEDSDAFKIMSKIHKLHNLESFIMDRAPSRKPHVCLLLDKICKMVRLRHFCFGGNISFKYGSENIWMRSSLFDNLQTLYNLGAGYEEDVEKILMLMPNLVELKALFCNSDEHIYPFPKLGFLKKLEALEVTHQGKYPCKIVSIHFPPYLKKLVLSKFGLPWTEISEIGKLECLEILELKHGAFKGLKWDMVDGEFPKLKYLSLSNLDIEEWNVSEDHLSFLKQLHVAWCRKLQELPSSLADIATLQGIKVSHCTMSVEDSAKRIKEEQEEIGNEGLVVEIH